jgi:tripartite-type tricarboxylate transporter receptor subunit TctC
VVATASLPAHSVKELKALANAKPGWLNFATQGAGTGPDIFRQWLNEQWKTDIVGVPYKGSNLIMNALIAGEIHFSRIAPLGAYIGVQMKAGKIRLLAVGTSKRLSQFPDVPTYAEVGLDGFPERTWWGLFAPAGTPEAMVKRMNSEIARLFREPKFAAYLESQYVEPAVTTPEAFAAFLKEDRERAGLVVKRYNIPRQ